MFLIFDSATFLLSQGVVPISWQAVLLVVVRTGQLSVNPEGEARATDQNFTEQSRFNH